MRNIQAYKENLIRKDQAFPVDVFIQDNLAKHVVVPPHWHECFELLYMMDGTAEQQINDKRFVAVQHDLVILNEGDVHSTYCKKGEKTRILVVKFLPDVVNSGYSRVFESKYIGPFLNCRSDSLYHLTGSSDTLENLRKLMMDLYDEFTAKRIGYEIHVKGSIYQLIALLIRHRIIGNPELLVENARSELLKLDGLFKYIENHYSERIDLQKAANMLNLSYSYFSRYFKKVTGKTFKEYVDFVRICEVEKLILTTGMNISHACYEAGFCNVSSFNRVFRRVKGYSPGTIKKTKTAKK